MTALFESVLRISLEATVLVLLVLGARLIVSRRPGFMLTALYVLIAIRLAVPLAISSPMSIQNVWNMQHAHIQLTQGFPVTEAVSDTAERLPVASGGLPATIANNATYSTAYQADDESSKTSRTDLAQPTSVPLSTLDIAAIIWIAGMAVFACAMLTGNALFIRRIKRNRSYDTPEFTALLSECKQALELNKKSALFAQAKRAPLPFTACSALYY